MRQSRGVRNHKHDKRNKLAYTYGQMDMVCGIVP